MSNTTRSNSRFEKYSEEEGKKTNSIRDFYSD
jgi:hypothetical protein